MIDAVIEELKTHQTQLDQDGVMVGVSRQALEELLAHVAAPAQPAPIAGLEPVAWQPIKTAPRDGTPILCFTPDYQSEFSDQSGIDVLWFDGAWLYNAEPVTFQPTHWMPLPASPNSALAQLEAHAAEQVRAERREFTCAARKQSLPEPADCDWPVCGCDPYADKVIAALEESGALKDQSQHPAPIAGLEPGCPFCGRDPFHRIDNGIGMEAVAVTCCDLGDLFFRGARAAPSEVTLSWEEFMEIGNKIAVLRMSAAQLEAHAAEQVRPLVEALEGLIEAVELDADEGLEGIGSYTGARLTDAKNAIRARGQV